MTDQLLLIDEATMSVIMEALSRAPQTNGLEPLGTVIENLKTGFFKPEYADIVPFFAAPADDPAVVYAQEHYADDDLEIDDRAVLSVGDTGTWVSAWVFIPRSELPND